MTELKCDKWRQWQARAFSGDPVERREAVEALRGCAEKLAGTTEGWEINQALNEVAPPRQWVAPAPVSEFLERWSKISSLFSPELRVLLERLRRQEELTQRVGGRVCDDLWQLVKRDLVDKSKRISDEQVRLLAGTAETLEALLPSVPLIAFSLESIREEVIKGLFKQSMQELAKAIGMGDFTRARQALAQSESAQGVSLDEPQIAEMRRILSEAQQFRNAVEAAWRQYKSVQNESGVSFGPSDAGVEMVPQLLSMEDHLHDLLNSGYAVVPAIDRGSGEDLRSECLKRACAILKRYLADLSSMQQLVDFCQLWRGILRQGLGTRLQCRNDIWGLAMKKGQAELSGWTSGMPTEEVEGFRHKIQELRVALRDLGNIYSDLGVIANLLRQCWTAPDPEPAREVASALPEQGQVLDELEKLLAEDLGPDVLGKALVLCDKAPNLPLCQVIQQYQKPLGHLIDAMNVKKLDKVEIAGLWFTEWKKHYSLLPPELHSHELRQALQNELGRREAQWRELMSGLIKPGLDSVLANGLLEDLNNFKNYLPTHSWQSYVNRLNGEIELNNAKKLALEGKWEQLSIALEKLKKLGREKEAWPLEVKLKVESARAENPVELPRRLMGRWNQVIEVYGESDAWALADEALFNAWEAESDWEAQAECCRLVAAICPKSESGSETECSRRWDWERWLTAWPKLKAPLTEHSVRTLVELTRGTFSPPDWPRRLRKRLEQAGDTVGLAVLYRLRHSAKEPSLGFETDPAQSMETQALEIIDEVEKLKTEGDQVPHEIVDELYRTGSKTRENYRLMGRLMNSLPSSTSFPQASAKFNSAFYFLQDVSDTLQTLKLANNGDLRKPDLEEKLRYVLVSLPKMGECELVATLRREYDRLEPLLKVDNRQKKFFECAERCGGISDNDLLTQKVFTDLAESLSNVAELLESAQVKDGEMWRILGKEYAKVMAVQGGFILPRPMPTDLNALIKLAQDAQYEEDQAESLMDKIRKQAPPLPSQSTFHPNKHQDFLKHFPQDPPTSRRLRYLFRLWLRPEPYSSILRQSRKYLSGWLYQAGEDETGHEG